MKTLKVWLKGIIVVMLGVNVMSCAVPGGYRSLDEVAPAAPEQATTNTYDAVKRENPRSRPGLGTAWGEEVESSIRYTNFRRAEGRPAGIEMIYYNDKEGVAAMAGGNHHAGAGMQLAAGGLVSWGVETGWGMAENINSGGRRYIVGRKNATYTLRITNRCASALEVVLSVDGLDVMDGKPASIKKRGYIIQAGKTLEIEGFRTSEDAVAAFRFSSVAGSYANLRHGKTRNVGVIGMAVYTQQGVDPWRWGRGEIKQREGARAFAEAPVMGVRN